MREEQRAENDTLHAVVDKAIDCMILLRQGMHNILKTDDIEIIHTIAAAVYDATSPKEPNEGTP
jgi:hypothetical protein